MKPTIACFLFSSLAIASSFAAEPAKRFTGVDLSGTYDCTGKDAHDGDFKAVVTLKLDARNSPGQYAGYAYTMQVEGFGLYVGSAAAHGNHLAITFANENPEKKDYGTGIATVKRTKSGVTLDKYYFQPEYESGNHGFERCVRSDQAKR